MRKAQSSPEFHLDIEIERTFRKMRQLFKSKTNPNLEELDPDFIQSYNSNKSSSEKDSYVNMADNNNMIDEIDLFTTTHYIYDEDLCDNIADSKTSILWLLLFCYICRLYHIVVVCYTQVLQDYMQIHPFQFVGILSSLN